MVFVVCYRLSLQHGVCAEQIIVMRHGIFCGAYCNRRAQVATPPINPMNGMGLGIILLTFK
jgi:hypothetical protein